MVEFINEPVSVEVRLRSDGGARPLAFVWRGHHFQITSWGREQKKAQGEQGVHCYLVQTSSAETWELCQDTKTAQWLLTRHWARGDQAV